MASTKQGTTNKGGDLGLKACLASEQSRPGKNSSTTIVKHASAAHAFVSHHGGLADKQRNMTRIPRHKDIGKKPAWGSGLTPVKQITSPARAGARAPSSTIHAPHWPRQRGSTESRPTPTNRTLSFGPAPASALEEQSARGAPRREDAELPAKQGQAMLSIKHDKKKRGDVPAINKPHATEVIIPPPSSPRSPLDIADHHTNFGTAVTNTPQDSAAPQNEEADAEAGEKHRAPLEAKLAQAEAELDKVERALDKERRAGVAQEEGFARALQGSVKTVEAAEKEAQKARRSLAASTAQLEAVQAAAAEECTRRVAAENRIAHETEQRGEAEARARAAREALESARAEKEEAQKRTRMEALKRQQAEEQIKLKVRECAALRAVLLEEQAARTAAEEDAEGERTRGREDADAALHASAETVALLEEELTRGQSSAAAAARELEELRAKLERATAKAQEYASQLDQAQSASRETFTDAVATASKERASARALVAAAEARLAAADKRAAAAEQQVAEVRALALDGAKATATAVEELAKSEARRLESVKVAEKEAARRAQAEATLSESQASLARAEEANARVQEREAELAEELAKLHADRADSEERCKKEAGSRLEADAKASYEEGRRHELEQQLADGESARAYLESSLRKAEGLMRAVEAALVENEAKVQALTKECAERKLEEAALSAANARAKHAELQLEEARKQLMHQVQATQAAETAAAMHEADLRFQLANATSASATWQADVHRLDAALAAAESQEKELTERKAALERRLAQLKKQADAAAGGERRAMEEAAAAREEAAAARQEAAAARQEAEAALKAAYEQLQLELRAALAASEESATTLRSELDQANATWQAESVRIQAERDEALSAGATWRGEMQRLSGELAAVEKEREVFRETIDGLEERLTEEGRAEEAEAAAEREADAERSIERLEAEVAALKRDLEQARGQAPGASAKKTIADLQRTIDGLKQKLSHAEKERAEVSDQIYKAMGENAAEQRRLHEAAMAEAARNAANTAARLDFELQSTKAKWRIVKEREENLEKENVHLTVAMNQSAAAQQWLAQDNRIRELEEEVNLARKEVKRAKDSLKASQVTAVMESRERGLPVPESPAPVLPRPYM